MTNDQNPTSQTPQNTQTPSPSTTPEFTLNLDINDIAPSPVSATHNEEPNLNIQIDPIIETKPEPAVDTSLDEAKETNTPTETTEPTVEIQPEPIVETKPEPIIEQTPIQEKPIQEEKVIESQTIPETKSDFQKDQEMIAQIQNPSVVQTPVSTPIIQTPTATAGINLDDILGNASVQTPVLEGQNFVSQPQTISQPQIAPQAQSTPLINPVTQQVITQQTTLPNFAPQGNIYTIAPNLSLGNTVNFAKGNKKLLTNIGIGVAIALVGIFVLKTMYPLGTKTSISQPQDILAANPSSTDNSGVISEESGHSAAPDQNQSGFDAFQDIPAVVLPTGAELNFPEEVSLTGDQDVGVVGSGDTLTEDTQTATSEDTEILKVQINEYISQGKKALVLAKKLGDKDKIKDALFLYKKASTLLQDIENGTGINTDKISLTLNQLSGYAQKIEPTAGVSTEQPAETGEFQQTEEPATSTESGTEDQLPPLQ